MIHDVRPNGAVRITIVTLAALVAPFVACSSSKDGFDPNTGPTLAADAGDDSPACGGRRCSRDLHAVLDGCTDQAIESCGENMGCKEGACVPACDSAAGAQGSIGCSFWTTAPDVLRAGETGCYAAFIANTWNTPASVSAEFGGDPIDVTKSLYRATPSDGGPIAYQSIDGVIPPGEVGILFLSQSEATPDTKFHVSCPPEVTVAYHGILTKEHATSRSKAFHLSTTVPVSTYEIFPYGGAKSFIPAATLLYPSTSWSTSYLLVDAWTSQSNIDLGNPFIQIVAREDTTIRLRPRVDVIDGVGVTGGPTGALVTWSLKRGEVLELTQDQALGGSPLEADHPVAVFGGHQCANVPAENPACDSLYQQIPPVQEWSSTYSAVPYQSRREDIAGAPRSPESVTWQIVAANDGTILSYDPAPPVGAPTTLQGGQNALFDTESVFSVNSQDANHPIYMAVYMTSSSRYSTPGDPDFVNVVPNDQFLDHYVFFVDHTYATSTLTFVRRKDGTGFHDVTLDCFGPVTNWQPIGSGGSTEYAWVELTRNGVDLNTPIGQCSHGRHEASSDGAFALYVWGVDDFASYGYPAGAGSRPTSEYHVEVH